jgi:hypothetical protein
LPLPDLAPKPKQLAPEEIEAFERSGAGHDRQPAKAAPAPASIPAEPTERLSLDLPAGLHTRFKTVCSATKRKMTAEVKAFIERRTAELEAEAGITRNDETRKCGFVVLRGRGL